jgi:hypothetical protein
VTRGTGNCTGALLLRVWLRQPPQGAEITVEVDGEQERRSRSPLLDEEESAS